MNSLLIVLALVGGYFMISGKSLQNQVKDLQPIHYIGFLIVAVFVSNMDQKDGLCVNNIDQADWILWKTSVVSAERQEISERNSVETFFDDWGQGRDTNTYTRTATEEAQLVWDQATRGLGLLNKDECDLIIATWNTNISAGTNEYPGAVRDNYTWEGAETPDDEPDQFFSHLKEIFADLKSRLDEIMNSS